MKRKWFRFKASMMTSRKPGRWHRMTVVTEEPDHRAIVEAACGEWGGGVSSEFAEDEPERGRCKRCERAKR